MLSPRIMSSPQMIQVRRVSSGSKLNKRAYTSIFTSVFLFFSLGLFYRICNKPNDLELKEVAILRPSSVAEVQYILPKNQVRLAEQRTEDSYRTVLERIALFHNYLEDLDGNIHEYPWNAHMRQAKEEEATKFEEETQKPDSDESIPTSEEKETESSDVPGVSDVTEQESQHVLEQDHKSEENSPRIVEIIENDNLDEGQDESKTSETNESEIVGNAEYNEEQNEESNSGTTQEESQVSEVAEKEEHNTQSSESDESSSQDQEPQGV
ncbi:unnamed protein product [Kuraishia capsulata CBS 1993]|uniref:Uncharacterized protein n=1 Tax=Kuraishia capsulata CBS 1993 TaxID=1382522 RepID=W6MMI8_9ASCO|nr:uncharacterized protein KUCA_T00003788001 [Kuraishia capsulata CBS 1993]CDK27809.1 unnamed protein product [Kuraishia capsulata CBS 1993]